MIEVSTKYSTSPKSLQDAESDITPRKTRSLSLDDDDDFKMVKTEDKEDVYGIKQDPKDQFNNMVNQENKHDIKTTEMIDDKDLEDESDKESES